MREDMYKVIVERPRHWKFNDARAARRRDDFESPMRLGMRVGYGYRALNENLAPLRRYLCAQLGRPWSAVFSEICAHIDRRNTVQQHIHQHIRDFIAVDVEVREGRLIDLTRRYGLSLDGGVLRQELYVDPVSGLIRQNPAFRSWRQEAREQRKRDLAEIHARKRVLDEFTQLLLLDGHWFEVMLQPLPETRTLLCVVKGKQVRRVICESRYDVVLRRRVSYTWNEDKTRHGLYGKCRLYAASKRQLSRRELKAHDLR
jgi:hypothetical protein